MAVIDTGTDTAGKANVDLTFNLQVNPPGNTSAGVARGGGNANAGAAAVLSEVDGGTVTGARLVVPPEADADFRIRVDHDTMLDLDLFNYTAQNTGKHNYVTTTLAAAWTIAGVQFNSGSITTTTTGARVKTYAEFPVNLDVSTYFEMLLAFSAPTVPANVIVDYGAFRDSGANPFTPTDGVSFRATPAGFQGVVTFNGVDTLTAVFAAFAPVINQVYKFTITYSNTAVQFWINDILYGSIPRQDGSPKPVQSVSLPLAMRQAIVGGAAGGVFQATLKDYAVSIGGPVLNTPLDQQGNRALGSHQGLSGGVMGSLASYVNSTTPAGAAGANTTALVTGLGGQANVNAIAAAATDLIMTSYQVPAGTIAIQGRRLVLRGVYISAANLGAIVASSETTLAWSLAFGHTAVSLATAEATTTKAPRREALGIMSWPIGAAIGAGPREGRIFMPFASPIYVNPGEFIATVAKFIGGALTASQTIYAQVTFDYGWE